MAITLPMIGLACGGMLGLACGGEMLGLVDQPAGRHANHSHLDPQPTDSFALLVAFFLAKYSPQQFCKIILIHFRTYLESFLFFLPYFTPVFFC
jgi:hypothetical protein